MKRFALVFAALVLLTFPANGQDLRAVYARTQNSVLLLKLYDRFGAAVGTGTGFVVSGGLIVTNHHVIADAHSVEAVRSDQQSFPITSLVTSDEANDLAILSPAPVQLPALTLASAPAAVGQRVVVVGGPLGLAGSLSEGLVSAIRSGGPEPEHPEFHKSLPVVQITAPVSPGSSGSPVMDEEGKVIAVVVSGYSRAQNLNFAAPAVAVSALLRAQSPGHVQRRLGTPGGRRSLLWNLAISAALLGGVGGAFFLLGRKQSKRAPTRHTIGGPRVRSFRRRA